MCDTMVALGNSTKDGSVVFAKNSDRNPNEPQLTIRVPRKQHTPGGKLKCTYIEIDQVEETYAVLLLKPSWMWGAEMGGNEFGLNIGNEAVFTREKQGSEALLGMDMLRLALERCRNSEEALDLLIVLLERYGQGGNCGYKKKFFYHNSFLIADPQAAWVLETAGEYWAAEKVKDVRSISNRLSIGSSFDRSHPDLIKHAVDKGWCKGEADFNFSRCYSDPLITRFSGSPQRSGRSSCVLAEEKGRITPQTMKKILRSHE
ncbi:MAG: C69 family dipeptidase, partial [Clostridia bacterium]|nr:C69 family dipeptidase [Clostridia bacterium]